MEMACRRSCDCSELQQCLREIDLMKFFFLGDYDTVLAKDRLVFSRRVFLSGRRFVRSNQGSAPFFFFSLGVEFESIDISECLGESTFGLRASQPVCQLVITIAKIAALF